MLRNRAPWTAPFAAGQCGARGDVPLLVGRRSPGWRRYFGSEHFENGTSLRHLQRLMRHADPQTTAGYDHSAFTAARKAAAGFELPWDRRENQ